MKQRFLLLMMTALLSVGAWATTENVWTGSVALGYYDSNVHVVDPNFASCYSKIRKGDNIVVTVTITGNYSNEIKVYKADGNGWYVDGALTEVKTNYESSETPKKIVFPVTDAILEALAVEDTWGAHRLYFYGGGETVTSVDVEYNNGKATIYDGQVQAYGWGYQLLPHLFTLAQDGDVLSIDVSDIGGTNWGAEIYIANKSHKEGDTDTEYENLLSANPGTSVPTTVKFVLTEDVLTIAKSTGLYLNGGTYTYTSVDLLYAHDVTIAGGITNGSVTASKSKAVYGETVTLTAAPDGNYELGTLTVTDGNSASVAVTDNGDGTYSFDMPATAVTVSATFNHVEEPLGANDVALNTDRIICTDDANTSVRSVATSERYYSSSGELWVGSGEHNGWDLSLGRPVSTAEFSGVYLNYKSGTKNVKMEIVYEDGTTQTSDMLSGSNSTTIDFNKSGVVKYVKFIRNTDTDAMVAIRQIALKGTGASASTPASSLTLTYETLMDSGKDGETATVTYDNTDSKQQFTITSGTGHWAGWIFTLPIPTSLYKGVNFNMTSVPTNGAIEIVYEGGATQTLKLTTGNNIVNFVYSGNITQIKFNVAGTYQMGTCSASNTYLAKVTSAKYATYGAVNDAIDFSTADPSGLKAYIAYMEAGVVKLKEVSKVPANTAVVLFADVTEATSYTLSTTTEATENVDANQLHVSDGNVTGNGSTIYVLANKTSHGVGFYKFKNGSTVPAGKVYLQIPSVSSVPEFFGFGDDNETTGITMVQGEGFMVNGSDNYYDLQGRRVAQPTVCTS